MSWHEVTIDPQQEVPYTSPEPMSGWAPSVKWCCEQWGNNADAGWAYFGSGLFRFRDDDKYTWFKLRWA